MARAYNRWGEEMRETSGGRVLGLRPGAARTTWRAPSRRSSSPTTTSAIRCFWARPDQFNHRSLGDRYYDPIYELLQDLDCAFATHEYMGLNAPTAGSDRFDTFTEWHTVVHPHEAQCAVLSMICTASTSGSRACACAYMEAGCGWLPSWLHRIDEHLELAGGGRGARAGDLSATDYFRRNCWISTECDDRFVADVIRWLGDEHIVFETDFPHPDSKYPHATEHFLALDDVIRAVEAQGPVGQRRRPVPVPAPARCRRERRPVRRPFRPSTTRSSCGPSRHRPSTSRRAWLDAARGDRAGAAAAGCGSGPSPRTQVPFFARRWDGAGFDPRPLSGLDDLEQGARLHGPRHPHEHRARIRRGVTTRAVTPADALARADAGVHVGRDDREVPPDLLHAVGPGGGRRPHRPAALPAGHPTRRRRPQLVGLRDAQRGVHRSTRRCIAG